MSTARTTRKTDVVEKTPAARKPRTRPVPTKSVSEEQSKEALAPVVVTDVNQAMLLMMGEMQKQIANQQSIIAQMLENQGKTIEQAFNRPPNATTTVIGQEPIDESSLPPGSYLPGNNWKPWTPSDINDEERFPKVHVVPYPIPNLVWPEYDEEGRQKIRIIKNDLECWLTVGEDNYVSDFFAEEYRLSFQNWKELEKFKRTGGRGPWVHGGRHGENTWMYNADVISFGMDEDGRPITIDTSIWEILPDGIQLPE